mgnify:FL=1
MKDFPVFPTQHGAASLILKEIPYRGEAYIQIQSTQEPDALLEECIHFCAACGAERVYAAGHDILETAYPLHTSIYRMTGTIQLHEEEIPAMFPVTEQTAERWRECYNQRMKNVDNAATLESRDTPNIVQGNAYFIHRNGILLGIGWIEENKLRAIASMQPGAGEALCRAMQSLIPQQQMTLEVASTNQKAIALYERLGLIKVEELSRWYRVK